MKKALVIFFLLGSLATQVFAQDQGNLRFHALGTYGFRFQDFGVGGGIEYFFADNFALMPSFTKLFPRVGNGSNFSADLRYYLSEGPSQIYVMAGYSQSFENTAPGDAGTRRNYVGANLGVGAFIPLTDWVGLSTEVKFQSQNLQQAGVRIGLAFPLN